MRKAKAKKLHAGKTLGRAGATPLAGSLPPVTQDARPCIARVQESENASCNAGCNTSRITKGGEARGTSESTIEATKNYNPSGPPGGRSQTQLRRVRRIHRREHFIRGE